MQVAKTENARCTCAQFFSLSSTFRVSLPKKTPLLQDPQGNASGALQTRPQRSRQGTARPLFQFIANGQFKHRLGASLVPSETLLQTCPQTSLHRVLCNSQTRAILHRVSGCTLLRMAPTPPLVAVAAAKPAVSFAGVSRPPPFSRPAAPEAELYVRLHALSCAEIIDYVAWRGLRDNLFRSVLERDDARLLLRDKALAKSVHVFLENLCRHSERGETLPGTFLREEMQKCAVFMRTVVGWTRSSGPAFRALQEGTQGEQREQIAQELQRFHVFKRAQGKEKNRIFHAATGAIVLACSRLRTVCVAYAVGCERAKETPPRRAPEGEPERRVNVWRMHVFGDAEAALGGLPFWGGNEISGFSL